MTLSRRFLCVLVLFGFAAGGCNSGGSAAVSDPAIPPTSPKSLAKTETPEVPPEDTLAAVDTPQPVAPVASPPAPVDEPAGLRDCSFDDLKFEMTKGDPFYRNMLTPQIEQLVGKRIRIRGYILPSFQQRGLKEFVLVRDNMECCFGPGAALYDCVLIHMQPGKSTNFSVRPVAVEGVFSVEEFLGPDGKHLAIYRLDGESVN